MLIQKVRQNPLFLVIAGVILVAAIVFAWWTISPLFIRTTLVEGQNINVPSASNNESMIPTSTATTATTATAMMAEPTATAEVMADTNMTPEAITPEDSMSSPTPQPEDTMDGDAMDAKPEDNMGPVVLAAGNFDHKDSIHYADGQAILAREADGSYVVRLQDLAAANGPDLYVYVSEHPNPSSSDELHTGEYNLGNLKATDGSFSYTLDPAIDATKIKSVVIYCRAFSVIFSTAALAASEQ